MLNSTVRNVLLSFFCLTDSFANSPLDEMSLEEKVGQLFIVCFKGETVNEEIKELVQKYHIGGVIYYNWANGLHSPSQVRNLSLGLQKLTLATKHKIPLLISADQEGGIVARLTSGFTPFPGNKALAMTNDPELANQSAYVIGKELLNVGVNFNLAPVVDINNNPKNPVIGIRSFGDTKETVINFSAKAIEGYRKAGVLTSLKHYPGHGDIDMDSHFGLPFLYKTKEALDTLELAPFARLSSVADTIMTAHIMVPSIDPVHCATLSKPILDILRNELHFNGVIISDSLVMEGVLKNSSSLEDATITALNAGCDILLFGGKQLVGTSENKEITPEEVAKVHAAVLKAVKEGVVKKERLDEAVERVLLLKKKIQPIPPLSEKELNAALCEKDSVILAKKISSLAIQTLQNTAIPPLKTQKVSVFAPKILKNPIQESPLLSLGKETSFFFFDGLSPTEEETEKMLAIADESEIFIFCSYNAWKNPSQAHLISLLHKSQKPLIQIVARDPADENICKKVDFVAKTYSPSVFSFQEVCKKLP